MWIACCYTRLHPDTRQALADYAPQTELVALDPDDDLAYWKALAERWGKGDLLVIEQDIVVRPHTVATFLSCQDRSDWCASPYPAYDGYPFYNDRALGCTRFSIRLQKAVQPETFRAPWQTMADRFIAMFDPLYPHQHAPVGHRHPMPEGVAA